MEVLLDLLKLPQVNDEQNKHLISKITDEEIKKAISNLSPIKAAGLDGFPRE